MRTLLAITCSATLTLLLAFQFGCNRQSANQTGNQNSDTNTAVQKYFGKIKAQAETLNQASIRGDYATAADLTHPKLIEFVGGREQYMAMLNDTRAEMLAEQVQLLSATVDPPTQILEAGNQIHAVVPVTWRMKVTDGVLVGRAYMIGVSEDRGENWKFVSAPGEQLDPQQLKALFPAAADKLQIPASEQPALERSSPSP